MYLVPDKDTENGTIKYFHFEMEEKMENRRFHWKFLDAITIFRKNDLCNLGRLDPS